MYVHEGVTEDALLVHLDTETARRLHELWASSVEHRKAARPQDRLLTGMDINKNITDNVDITNLEDLNMFLGSFL